MNAPTKPAKADSMRDVMPQTSEWITRMRAQWGKDHVNHCVRQAMGGLPGWFYAMEGGHVVGTPWAEGTAVDELQRMSVLCGRGFAAFMRDPVQTPAQGEAAPCA